ncbi:MAG: sulfite exporter TauE/SafE family protein [Bacteroidia bacterium]
MTITEILGFAAATLIGVSLGLIGGGGSILTVPVLVYLLGVDPVLSTAYSLFIVGSTSLVGAIQYMQKKLVNYKAAIVFAIPSFTTVFLTRKFLVPAIPDPIFNIGSFEISKNIGIMIFFALIMLAASYSMINDKKKSTDEKEDENAPLKFNFPMIALEGGVVGVLTGIVGAGGGFLIIPALVILAKLPMKMAVGSSLLIIAAKSLIGFLGDLGTQEIEWDFLMLFTSLSILGIFVGTWLSKFIPGNKLKKGFGWFVVIMAIYIIVNEIFLK